MIKNDTFNNIMQIIKFSTPVILASISSVLANILCTRILGMERGGNLYLLAIFLPISYALIGIFETIRIASLSYSRAPKKNLILNIVSLVLIIFLIFLFLMIVFLIFENQMISIFNVRHGYRDQFTEFTVGMLISGFIMGLSSALTTSLAGIRKIYSAMFISMLASSLVVLLSYLMAYRIGLGLGGYVLAIFLAYLFSGFLAIILLRSNGLLLKELKFIKVSSLVCQLREAGKVMIPVGAAFAVIFFSLFFLNQILAHFDQAVISGFGVAYRIQALILLPAVALGTAMALLREDKKIILTGLIFSILIYFLVGVAIYYCRDYLSNFISQNSEVSKNSSVYLKLVSLSYVGSGPLLTYLTMLEQTGFASLSLFLNSTYFLVIIVFGGGLSIFFHHYQILYESILISNCAAFLLILLIIAKEAIYA